MAKPEQCSHCDKPATIHLTQIINNQIHKVDLCEECPYKKGVTDPEGFSLADFLIQGQGQMQEGHEEIVCENCGITPADFRKTGRFGCPVCYEHFRDMLKPMLSNMHKDTLHRGKIPEKAIARLSHQRRLQELEESLQSAVEKENYEEAARLRDQIKEIKEATPATE